MNSIKTSSGFLDLLDMPGWRLTYHWPDLPHSNLPYLSWSEMTAAGGRKHKAENSRIKKIRIIIRMGIRI